MTSAVSGASVMAPMKASERERMFWTDWEAISFDFPALGSWEWTLRTIDALPEVDR